MKPNYEEIIRALQCCTSSEKSANCSINCPFGDMSSCEQNLMYHALTLIRELTESLDRVQKQCGEIIVECDERDAERLKQVAKLTEENERLSIDLEAMRGAANSYKMHYEAAKAETVHKMQERIKADLIKRYGTLPHTNYFFKSIDLTAKELLKGADT